MIMFSYIFKLRPVDKPHFPTLMHAWRVIHHGLYTDKYIWHIPSICSHTSYGMLVGELIGLTVQKIIKQSRRTFSLNVEPFFFLVFFCLTVRNNASKQQTYKELNLYLRRYNIVLSCSIELFCLFFLNQARTPLVTLKCCCRFCEA